MNVGFSNLDTLRKHLLADSLKGIVQFDGIITTVGLMVAAQFENFCNRKFARAVNDTVVLKADYAVYQLSRYPVESVSMVEIKMRDADGWVAQDMSLVESTSPNSGLVYLDDSEDGGPYWAQVRFTFTGGYWWETLEPEDPDGGYPSAMPAGATALPDDLRGAWLLQCRDIWSKIDKLGTGIVDEPGKQSLIGDIKLSQGVREMLRNFACMQMV